MNEIVMIDVNKLNPHPNNPRKDLGYEMSDEEKQIQDGTHEIFQREKSGGEG